MNVFKSHSQITKNKNILKYQLYTNILYDFLTRSIEYKGDGNNADRPTI